MEEKNMKIREEKLEEKGITLIALTVTVILVLFMAGITTKIIIDSKIVSNSKNAEEIGTSANEKEQISLAIAEIRMEQLGVDKQKSNQNSEYEIEINDGRQTISVFASSLAEKLNKQNGTLDTTLTKLGSINKLASKNPIKISSSEKGVYQSNKNGILVWDYDKKNDYDYMVKADYVKVKFENTSHNHIYVVNKWTGDIEKAEETSRIQMPINEPGNYHFTVNAGTKVKWVCMKKYGEVIPAGAQIKYTFFVSDDKQTWKEYPSIPEIDVYTQYIRIYVEFIPNSKGQCPKIDEIAVKFRKIIDGNKNIGEVVSSETKNIKISENGYEPEDTTEDATLTQKIELSKPMKSSEILKEIDIPQEESTESSSTSSNVSNKIFASKDGNTWTEINESTSDDETYSYVKTVTTIKARNDGKETVIGIATINPEEQKVSTADTETYRTIATKYYYAIAEGKAEWIRIDADTVLPKGTRIKYSSTKSNDGENWTAYSDDIKDNNDSEYVKVKVEFQISEQAQNNRPILNELEIVCNYNGEELAKTGDQTMRWKLSLTSQNTKFGTVSSEKEAYQYNESVTVKASPVTGYKLVGWSDGKEIVSTENTYTFTMPNHEYSLNAMWVDDRTSLGEVLTYDEHTTFVVVKTTKSWAQAQEFAKTYGGRLAVINNQEKQDLIYSRVKSIGDAWIGATDSAQEGVWLYSDGTPVTYTNWNDGEPNNLGDEDYAEMYMSSGKWNDLNGTANYPFIIEFNN